MPLPTLWELSKAWYHNRLSPEYRGRTAADSQQIFRGLGLTSDFWSLAGDPDAPQK
jgi:hypothetical protein